MNDKPPYLADVQVGDKLYFFLQGNEEYEVVKIRYRTNNPDDYPIKAKRTKDNYCESISFWGTIHPFQVVPHFLYASVDVLDPKNLPPRPWRPKKREWVWARRMVSWELAQYRGKKSSCFLCDPQFGDLDEFQEIAPFKGELPPGLEEEDE